MLCHENTRPTRLIGTLFTQTGNFVIGINFVVLENSQLDLLLFMLVLLGGRVCLLLALLSSTEELKISEKSGVLEQHRPLNYKPMQIGK